MAEPTSPSRLSLARLLGGQFSSLVASGTTQFALGIWVFERTHHATSVTLLITAYLLPFLLLSPLAGALADRLSRKRLMLVGDLAAACTAAATLALLQAQALQVWHLYLFAVVNGGAQTFHWPAFAAVSSEVVRARHYGRVHGFTSLAENGAKVFAPALGGVLLAAMGLPAILWLNLAGSLAAAALLVSVRIPERPFAAAGAARSLWRDSWYGFAYLAQRRDLLTLQLIFFAANFFFSLATALVVPYVLQVTGGDAVALGQVQAAGAAGGIAGALLMGAWGGPARRPVTAILLFWTCTGLAGVGLVGWMRAPVFIALAIFIYTFFGPLIGGSSQALWQRTVPLDAQGRVFATRRLIAWASGPLGAAAAGPLADRVFGPWLQGPRTPFWAWLPSGPGAGIGTLMTGAGLCIALVALASLRNRRLAALDAHSPARVNDRPDGLAEFHAPPHLRPPTSP
ncbi:MFS transporter [Roseateles sp.]|uniref:MFS transporter n=1 Tax=Roseateles sp. TaxID=1971397 RepID=UPI002F407F39